MFKPTATIERMSDGKLHVWVTWSGPSNLDRADGYGWSVGAKRNLAERLARAINAGKVFGSPEMRTDVNGKTYVSATCCVMGRHMNADLKRLGY